jgi:hypothetical protein
MCVERLPHEKWRKAIHGTGNRRKVVYLNDKHGMDMETVWICAFKVCVGVVLCWAWFMGTG